MGNNLQLLYFGAEHCSMCRTAKPQFKETCANLGLREGTGYMILDTDECDESLITQFGIRSIPVVVIRHLDSGEVIFKGHAIDGIKKIKELWKKS